MKILFASSEITPFAKTGGLADVAAALPKALAARGHDLRLALPFYGQIDAARFGIEALGVDVTVTIDGAPRQGSIYTARLDGLTVYLLRQDIYFERTGLYGYASGDHPDNAQRFTYFCRALLEALPRLGFCPDIIHANDWQTALLPTLLRHERGAAPFYAGCRSVLTLHNLGYQGLFPIQILPDLGFAATQLYDADFEYYGQVSLLKSGVISADAVTTVSPTYAREVCTPEAGMGFDGILRRRGPAFSGIVNGIDQTLWDPATDAALVQPFSADAPAGKAANKAALQRHFGLQVAPQRPLLAMVSRFDRQKGLDLLEAAWPQLLQRDLQLVLIGSGDSGLQQRFAALTAQTPQQTAGFFAFDDAVARLTYAGSDFFMMPSHYEPCGLAQMIALRYGSLPLVRRTGGLADTVFDADSGDPRANGVVFAAATPEALLQAIDRALTLYADQPRYREIQAHGMRLDHSWSGPARDYETLYLQLLEKLP